MFDMKKIGKKLVDLRKKGNLTQMYLADKLNVSFQAVSSWERGLTMPDISKLPEISGMFNVSIDELLDNEKGTQIIKSSIEGNTLHYLQDHRISAEEFSNIAPLLKPEQLKEVSQGISINSDVDSLLSHLPFFSIETAERIVGTALANGCDVGVLLDNNPIPFVSQHLAEKIALHAVEKDNTNLESLLSHLPFFSKEAIDKIIKKALEHNCDAAMLISYNIFPFISSNISDQIALEAVEQNLELESLLTHLPFFNKATVDLIIETALVKKYNITLLYEYAFPFASDEICVKLAELVAEK